ncbi:MAG: tRNA-specific adenosine deaminase [Firmicutes bacterium ADurb.Bin373]|nr:MAG: tRNA-specific adenosine deaminase [Firmicutes bacterium ADurb.Bin373]
MDVEKMQGPPAGLNRQRPARPGWDEYFMNIASVVATRSTCLRRQVGSVVVRDKRILCSGYNGAPAGLKHCLDIGCLREQKGIPSGQRHELCRGLHAEQNAIIQAAVHGTAIKGSVYYVTHQPCILCAKILINAGIKKVVFQGEYPDPMALELFAEAGVELMRYQPE